MIRLCVTGGRHYGEVSRNIARYTPTWYAERLRAAEQRIFLYTILNEVRGQVEILMHGAAKTGADKFADNWAAKQRITIRRYAADWYPAGFGKLDRAAGPKRNAWMIEDGKPDLVIAFEGGNGTADCVRRAQAAGIRVIETWKGDRP